jgi:DNA-binding PadR family transcriptional regulator
MQMKKDLVTVSELEGAILGEIAQAAETTAYAVRKSFATSLSNELSASKGAIYPMTGAAHKN